MQQFEHEGILYEELPDGKARVIGPAPAKAPAPAAYIPPDPNSPRAIERAEDRQFKTEDQNIQRGQYGLLQQREAREAQLAPPKAASDFIERFKNDPAVKAYRESLPVIIGATQAQPGGAGDLSVVYGWAKAMDPNSVVREGEVGMAQAATGPAARVQHYISAYRLNEGGSLPPQVRQQLIEEMRTKGRQLNLAYSQSYKQAQELLRQSGLDPSLLGPHEGDKFAPAERQYVEQKNDGGTGPTDPNYLAFKGETAPPVNDRTQAGFDLQQAPSIASMTPEQTAAYQAWWKANPNPSPDQLNQFFVAVGLGPAPNAAEIIAAAKEGRGISTTIENRLPQHVQERLDQRIENTGAGGAGVAGGADTVTMGTFDELSALGDSVSDLASGQGWNYGANLSANRQFQEGLQDQHGGAYLTGQIAGGLVLPTFGARTAGQLAKVGAGYGGAYGAGSGEGNLGDRAANALLHGTAGAGLGAGLGYAGPKIFEGGRRVATAVGRKIAGPTTPEQQALLRAGDREGVPVNMGDVYPNLRNTIATQETIPGSSGPIRQGIQAGRDAMEARVGQLGQGGTARGEGALGERVYKGGERYLAQHRVASERDYNTARSLAGADFKATADTAAQEASKTVAALSETPNSNKTVLGLYRDILADLTDNAGNLKPLSIDAIKEMRRNIRLEMSSRGLVGSKDDARLQAIVDAASADMHRALAAKDPRAAAAYQKADAAYAERIEFINGTLRNFMGTKDKPISGEALVAKIRGMAGSGARGNARELNRFLSVLSPEERADVAASFAANLGRKSTEEPFSPATFLSNIRKIDERSRIVLFGRDGARSVQNLIKLATAKTESVNRLNNSRAGMVVNYRTVLSNLLLGVPGGGAIAGAATGIGGPTTAAVGLAVSGAMLAGSRAMSKAFMNEAFTRAVAQAPATTSGKAITAHIGRLRKIAAKDPNVRAVVIELERKLFSFANDNVGQGVAADSVGDDQ